ncbi:MAG: DegT/DnrJ/EryC1/StrS family aminotransferase [Methanomassiliicoccales archaeon]|nr:DegT/DnrJ/EryC1/StrS family aminotransferase [Methanomassiliicoccales archaeon]
MDDIPQARPVMDKEMIEAATSALQNERLVLGESVFKFEEAFANYIGVKRAVTISSGTDALILALLALDVEDKEVITTPFSFIATANTIYHAHGQPRFCDVRADDYNLDALKIVAAVRKKTKAIMPVHLFGHPCDMKEINELAEEKGLKVIEDACQAHGAVYKGKKAGALGDVGCFSFYPTKNMTVGGDGGMVTTDDEDIANMVAKLRDCGRTTRYSHDVLGYTSRLNTSNAAIGLVQLKHLDRWNERRRAIAKRYQVKLKGVAGVELPPKADEVKEPVYHCYAVRAERRDNLAKYLAEKKIATAVHYPIPIHMQPAYVGKIAQREGDLPVSEMLSQKILSLPIFPSMTDEQVDRVCETVKGFYK